MSTRRDFLLNLASTAIISGLSQPIYLWGSDSADPRCTVFIFLRGGSDGLHICHALPSASQIWNYLASVRGVLMLPESLNDSNPYARSEIIPIGSQFGLHPWWERLMNLSNPAPGKPTRVKCDLLPSGQPLASHIAVRLMKGVGMMHYYDQPVNSLRQVQFEKSHFN
ncbi:MAG: hypothetical protein NZO16_07940, partial [Deltaproteobacteria bacterium]|nr:hypothetical protein [Deltaproteobacteria bacterium]